MECYPWLSQKVQQRQQIIEFISIKSWAVTGEDEPGMMEGTADVPHQIADVHFPEAASVFDAATALNPARDMVAPQPTLMELLVRHVLLLREFLPQIEINSTIPGLSQPSCRKTILACFCQPFLQTHP
jgi:hypothetical protein